MVYTGLIPSKIAAFGVEFSSTDQKAILSSMAAVTSYFFLTFLIYAWTDFLAWRLAIHNVIIELRKEKEAEHSRKMMGEDIPSSDERDYPYYRTRRYLVMMSRPVSIIRAIIEFLVPLLVAIYAIMNLLHGPTSQVQTKNINGPISQSTFTQPTNLK